ncbi:MAG: nucleotidyltransferase family protein [bacterium]|nr:nucleotidyltransferase family protein [bacterium]
MQVVILAAGRGSRMGDLVKDTPKPMLKVAGKTLLEHKFDALPDEVDEIILVVGYLASVIQEHYGDSYNGKKISYVTQENIVGGTADALWYAKDILEGKFLVMMGDDIYSREDIQELRAFEWAMLIQRVPDTVVGGRVILDTEHHITEVIEGNKGGEGAVSANLFALDTRIFDFPQIPKASGSSELGLPQTILAASKASGIPFNVVEATRWIQITNPDDIARAEERLKS